MSRIKEFNIAANNTVKAKINRGFNKLIIKDIASDLLKQKLIERNSQKIPKTIKELFDLLNEVNQDIEYPKHLKPYLDTLEAVAKGEQHFITFSAPPSHGKSFAGLVALLFLSITSTKPTKNAFITYSREQGRLQMLTLMGLCDQLGVSYSTSGQIINIAPFGYHDQHNSILMTGLGSGITGRHFDKLIICDDLIANEIDASSAQIKETIWAMFWSSIRTRQKQKSNMSIINIQTRWVRDDPAGRLIKEGWKSINLKAICDDDNDPLGRKKGELLAPHLFSLDFLLKLKEADEMKFSAMYQCTALTDTYQIFSGITHYNDIPQTGQFIWSAGIDLAYSTNIKSDYSSIVIVKYDTKNNLFYLVDSYMAQKLYTDFIEDIKLFKQKYNLTAIRFDAGAMESYAAGAQLIKHIPEIKIIRVGPGMGKLQRAYKASQLWNDGKILVPEPLKQSSIMAKTIATIQLFAGNNKGKDDCVDSLASAINCVLDITNQNNYNKSILNSNQPKQKRNTTIFTSRARDKEQVKL